MCYAETLAKLVETSVHVEAGELIGSLVLPVAQVEWNAQLQQTVGKPDVPLPQDKVSVKAVQ